MKNWLSKSRKRKSRGGYCVADAASNGMKIGVALVQLVQSRTEKGGAGGLKMPLKDITMPFPSPGMIRRAKLMDITPTEDGWEVQQPYHYLHKVVKEIKFYTCDCVGFKMRGMCSHVAAVKISQAPKAREDLFGDEK